MCNLSLFLIWALIKINLNFEIPVTQASYGWIFQLVCGFTMIRNLAEIILISILQQISQVMCDYIWHKSLPMVIFKSGSNISYSYISAHTTNMHMFIIHFLIVIYWLPNGRINVDLEKSISRSGMSWYTENLQIFTLTLCISQKIL